MISVRRSSHICHSYHSNFNPINKFYFQLADSNPNEQLFIFASLVFWMLKKLDVTGLQNPEQFDDPNATCSNIVAELKKLGIAFEFGPTKLKQAFGEACIYVLQNLVDLCILYTKFTFQQPVHKLDEYSFN